METEPGPTRLCFSKVQLMKMQYLILPSFDAEWNLAAEQFVFDALPRDRRYFLLWQNRNAVIIGKYQNTLSEIDPAYVKEHGIQVVRRLSGGGAVYHDLGNLNFSFISDADASGRIDLSPFCLPVIRALRSLDVPAELNGRNDMTVEGKKFSGNAQYVSHGRVLHHGTILFDSDLEAVGHALRADDEKLRSKGVPSVRSRVTNLLPYLPQGTTLETFRKTLLAHILLEQPGEAYLLAVEDLRAIEEIRSRRYACWEWNVGRSPAGSMEKKRRIEGCGTVGVFLGTDKGRIRSLRFFGDFFSSLEPELLAERLIGVRLDEKELISALADADPELYIRGMTREDLLRILLY